MVLGEVGLGDLLWTTIWVFFLVMFIWLFIAIVSDLFRDHEVSGVGKAVWVVALVIFPLLGSLVYLIVRGGGMAHRQQVQVQQAQRQFDDYIRQTASTGTGPVSDLDRLAGLRASGAITEEEFATMKARVTAPEAPAPS
jgi:Short C-terminal domain/Phospholipase_D-nuclease N-terminal